MKARYKKRVPLGPTSVAFSNSELSGEGRVLDLTAPGCLIESSREVTKGQYLHLTMFLSDLKWPLVVKLAVVRWAKANQFGVEFIKMEENERRVLNTFMAKRWASDERHTTRLMQTPS
jgi:hypothetical protein